MNGYEVGVAVASGMALTWGTVMEALYLVQASTSSQVAPTLSCTLHPHQWEDLSLEALSAFGMPPECLTSTDGSGYAGRVMGISFHISPEVPVINGGHDYAAQMTSSEGHVTIVSAVPQ